MLKKFWDWYEKYYTLNIVAASILFLLQLVHLYWLTTTVVTVRLWGARYFPELNNTWELMVTLVDYTEIPALLSVSLIYINDLRKELSWKPILYLLFLNSQWLHIFWITDEFVIEALSGIEYSSLLPHWLVWLAIGIDYLELPVMIDTIKKSIVSMKTQFLRQH